MKIAVNTRLLLPNKLEGIGWFTHETLQRVVQQHPEHQFVFIFDRPYDTQFIYASNVVPKIAFPQARHPYLWYLFFEWGVPRVLKNVKPDLFLSTDGWIPLNLKIPVVNVIHDINFAKHPEYIPKDCLGYYQKYFPQFAKQATRLATVSEYSKSEIHELYHVDNDKIDVVYNGANLKYRKFNEEEVQQVRDEITQGAPYFLFVGLISKRKNIARLFAAFDKFKAQDTQSTKLVVVGERKYWDSETESIYNGMKYKEEVVFLGRMNIDRLVAVTGAALAMMYVSLYEGFGIPIIEAYRAQIPVITSNVTSMPEVAGEGAWLVNPTDIEQIAQAMAYVIDHPIEAQKKVEVGLQQASKFTWDQSAERLWNTIEKVLS